MTYIVIIMDKGQLKSNQKLMVGSGCLFSDPKLRSFLESPYNAFGNSLQRFDFKGTLGPEGMLASDWLMSCVKFCAKPPSVSKRWVCHFFSL